MSEWTKSKAWVALLLFVIGYNKQWCLPNWHDSHSMEDTLFKLGPNFLSFEGKGDLVENANL